jgi:cytochrome c5
MNANNRTSVAEHISSTIGPSWLLMAGVLALALAMAPLPASAQGGARSGKAVVDAVCIACHGSGAKGAPKIGDKKAWEKRAAQGLTSLSQNAINGIRQMPPHGGTAGVTDFEIERAVTYMVNQSGGHWAEPISRGSTPAERSGDQVVNLQCSKCHESGIGGAPKIGDRTAWIPRLTQGLDPLVRSAINGHGGMPPRGGMANLTDAELRSAIVYMVNWGAGSATASPAARAATGPNIRVVEDVTINLGVISADRMRADPKEYPKSVYGDAPSAPEQYYVTVSLFDANNGKRIVDAAVRARVSTAAGAGPEKSLQINSIPNAPTYGNYFAMAGAGPYQVTLHITRPGKADMIQTQFEYSH